MYYQLAGTELRIIGSIHLLPPETPTIPTWVGEAFEWSQDLVLEHNPATALPLLRYSDGRVLSSCLSPMCYRDLADIWNNIARIPAPLEEFKPWAATIVLAGKLTLGVPGVEPYLINRCATAGRQIQYLEPPEIMFATLDALPTQIQDQAVRTFIDHVSGMRQNFSELAAAWLSRDVVSLQAVLRRSPLFLLQQLRDAIFGNRNRAWMRDITARARSPRRTLVCVGAGHLFANDGILTLLQDVGYNAYELS
jgi:hypothetical protein